MEFSTLKILWSLPLIQDIGGSFSGPYYLFSSLGKTASLILVPLNWTGSLLGRIIPTSWSNRLSSWKNAINDKISTLDFIGAALVQLVTSKFPILEERSSVVFDEIRGLLSRLTNTLGTHAFGRWSLSALNGVLRGVERIFAPFSGVMEMTDHNNNLSDDPKDNPSSINANPSLFYRGINLLSLGSLSKASKVQTGILGTLQSFRRSIYQIIRFGELKVAQTDKELVSGGGIGHDDMMSGFSIHPILNTLIHELKEALVSFEILSDCPKTDNCPVQIVHPLSLPNEVVKSDAIEEAMSTANRELGGIGPKQELSPATILENSFDNLYSQP